MQHRLMRHAAHEKPGGHNAQPWHAWVQAALRDLPLNRAQQNTVTFDLAPKNKVTP